MIDVKRYSLRMVDRYSGDGAGEIETHAYMKAEDRGKYVRTDDYTELLSRSERVETQRDMLREALEEILFRVSGCKSRDGMVKTDPMFNAEKLIEAEEKARAILNAAEDQS